MRVNAHNKQILRGLLGAMQHLIKDGAYWEMFPAVLFTLYKTMYTTNKQTKEVYSSYRD